MTDEDHAHGPFLQVTKLGGHYFVDIDSAIGELEDACDDPCNEVLLVWFRNARALASEHIP